ncbi:MAG TPA: hypothetical protein V6D10_00025 [Trichocoleus sp.]
MLLYIRLKRRDRQQSICVSALLSGTNSKTLYFHPIALPDRPIHQSHQQMMNEFYVRRLASDRLSRL